MLDWLIGISLRYRTIVLFLALATAGVGLWELPRMTKDVFPDLNRPTVTVMTEAAGLAPEEVEVLVTRPLEVSLNGLTGVERVRSASGLGLSIVWVEFGWGTDIYRDRQVVTERLQSAGVALPEGVVPRLAPISSIMGEVMLLGVRWGGVEVGGDALMAMRTFGEFRMRNRLMAIRGVSQVTVMGGVFKQYQVLTTPERLAAKGITLQELSDAVERSNALTGGGVMVRSTEESILRIDGRAIELKDIEQTPIVWREQRPILVGEVAEVKFGGPVPRGGGGVWVKGVGGEQVGGDAIILAVQKQPGVDTVALDKSIQEALDELQRELPQGMVIERGLFQQSKFIEAAVQNVSEAVRDGALWVVVVLFVFLWNFRVSVCSLIAMPLSILGTFLVFRWFGVSINTMTLGGIAVAIGDLVDDSIVDVENIYRRLKENRQLPESMRRSAMDVIYRASCEVRNSVVYATAIVVLVVIPLFGMAGLEGRLFAPLGMAYIVSLGVSLLVSLTVTPALSSYMLPGAKFLEEPRDPWLVRSVKWVVRRILEWTLDHSGWVLGGVAIGVVVSLMGLYSMGGEFLPEFQEGTYTVNLQSVPGTSLGESTRIARECERALLEIPEVVSVSRRTGRAELDEHAEGVQTSELDIRIDRHDKLLPGWFGWLMRRVPGLHDWGVERLGRGHEELLGEIRERVTRIPGVQVNIGQPISHRLDHVLSGVRAQVVIKVFGQDLQVLREVSQDVYDSISDIEGIVDLQLEPQVEVSQVRLQVRREEAMRVGLAPGDLAPLLETAYRGRVVSQIVDGEMFHDLVVWYDEGARNSPERIQETILDTPSGRRVTLGQVARVVDTTGPNTIYREQVERRVVVQCNVAGRDLSGVVGDIEERLVPFRERLGRLGAGYRLELGGQYRAQREAMWRLGWLGGLSVVAILLLLKQCLGGWSSAIQVLVNIPLAAMGAVGMLWWMGVTTLSLAHWVGFITLIGMVSRNGILMISHYQYLMQEEGVAFSKEMIVRGSLERLVPVLMTACTSFVGLFPLLAGAGEVGKEILHPLAVVVFGGMISTTLLDQLVTPALYWRMGRGGRVS
jgi:CzcA family heavy metal efflux pump